MSEDPTIPPPPPPPPAGTSGLAIASLVCGILAIAGCLLLTGIPAIITGHMAVSRISKAPEIGGKGLAIAGLIMGYLSILLTLATIAFMMLVRVNQPAPFIYELF